MSRPWTGTGFLWTSAHSHRYLVDHHGTTDIGPDRSRHGRCAPYSTNEHRDSSYEQPGSTDEQRDSSYEQPGSTGEQRDATDDRER